MYNVGAAGITVLRLMGRRSPQVVRRTTRKKGHDGLTQKAAKLDDIESDRRSAAQGQCGPQHAIVPRHRQRRERCDKRATQGATLRNGALGGGTVLGRSEQP